jgi:hypothetical protein
MTKWAAGLTIACVVIAGSGCTLATKMTNAALGRSGKAAFELHRLARAERATTLTDEQMDRRVAFIMERLDDQRLHAIAWQYGWLAVDIGPGIISSGIQAGLKSGNDREYFILEAVKSAIGTAYLLIDPMPNQHGADPIRAMPDTTHEDKMARLIRGEDMLAHAAERAQQRTAIGYHLGNLFFNLAGAGALYGVGNHSGALQSLLIDTASGEVQIWTQPWEGPGDFHAYEEFVAADEQGPGAGSRAVQPIAAPPPLRWQIVPRGLGLAVAAEF